jgi:hypothetical protein
LGLAQLVGVDAPGFVRRRQMPDEQPVGSKPDSPHERWTFGFLIDGILTRDPWMHRTDIAEAIARPLVQGGRGAKRLDGDREFRRRAPRRQASATRGLRGILFVTLAG